MPMKWPFHIRLIALRQARGYTQSDLAELVGVTQGSISRLESGTIDPSFETLQALCAALGCTIDALCGPFSEP